MRRKRLVAGKNLKKEVAKDDVCFDKLNLNVHASYWQNFMTFFYYGCLCPDLSEADRLRHLNSFSIFVSSNKPDTHILRSVLLYCLTRIIHCKGSKIRAVGYKILRLFSCIESDAHDLFFYQVNFKIIRSVDIIETLPIEKLEALKLTYHLLCIAPELFSVGVFKSLLAVLNMRGEISDKVWREACLIVLSVSVRNPKLFLLCDGFYQMLSIANSYDNFFVSQAIIFPLIRLIISSNFWFDISALFQQSCITHYSIDRFVPCLGKCRFALLAVFRTWYGLFHIAVYNQSDFKGLIQSLCGPESEDLLRFFDDLLSFSSPSDNMVESNVSIYDLCKKTNTNKSINDLDFSYYFPSSKINIMNYFYYIILHLLLQNGILDSLIDVVMQNNKLTQNFGLYLIRKVLRLTTRFMDSATVDKCHQLARLAFYNSEHAHVAGIVTRLPVIEKKSAYCENIYIDQQLFFGSSLHSPAFSKIKNERQFQAIVKLTCDNMKRYGFRFWHWDSIYYLIFHSPNRHWSGECRLNKIFCSFFLHLDKFVQSEDSEEQTKVAKTTNSFLRRYISIISGVCSKCDNSVVSAIDKLVSFLENFRNNLIADRDEISSCSAKYLFLFIGTILSRDENHVMASYSHAVKIIQMILTQTENISVVGFVLSSLDFSFCVWTRNLLKHLITHESELKVLLCLDHLHALALLQNCDFNTWGTKLLVDLLFHRNKSISNAAYHVIEHLSLSVSFVQSLITLNVDYTNLEGVTSTLMTSILFSNSTFCLQNAVLLAVELAKWKKMFFKTYVELVEERCSQSVANLDVLSEMKKFGNVKDRSAPVYLPPHLYGKLALHEGGIAEIRSHVDVESLVNQLRHHDSTEGSLLRSKMALWALGNIGMSELGVEMLREYRAVRVISCLSRTSMCLEIRALCYLILCLITSTQVGRVDLEHNGWVVDCLSCDKNVPFSIIKNVDSCFSETISDKLFRNRTRRVGLGKKIKSNIINEGLKKTYSFTRCHTKEFFLHKRSSMTKTKSCFNLFHFSQTQNECINVVTDNRKKQGKAQESVLDKIKDESKSGKCFSCSQNPIDCGYPSDTSHVKCLPHEYLPNNNENSCEKLDGIFNCLTPFPPYSICESLHSQQSCIRCFMFSDAMRSSAVSTFQAESPSLLKDSLPHYVESRHCFAPTNFLKSPRPACRACSFGADPARSNTQCWLRRKVCDMMLRLHYSDNEGKVRKQIIKFFRLSSTIISRDACLYSMIHNLLAQYDIAHNQRDFIHNLFDEDVFACLKNSIDCCIKFYQLNAFPNCNIPPPSLIE